MIGAISAGRAPTKGARRGPGAVVVCDDDNCRAMALGARRMRMPRPPSRSRTFDRDPGRPCRCGEPQGIKPSGDLSRQDVPKVPHSRSSALTVCPGMRASAHRDPLLSISESAALRSVYWAAGESRGLGACASGLRCVARAGCFWGIPR
jgi:hypothetical protein